MMNKLRILGCLLLSVMIFTLLTGCGSNDIKQNPVPDSDIEIQETMHVLDVEEQDTVLESDVEIQKAVALGIVSELPQNLDETVSHNQFCSMLTNVITLLYGESDYLNKWNELSVNAINESKEMTRGDGAFALLTAATATGMDIPQPNTGDCLNIDGDQLDLSSIDTSYFPWVNMPYHNRETEQEDHDAKNFAARYPWNRFSQVSQKSLLELDEAQQIRYQDSFTMREAIYAALRCYESWVPREYVKATDVAATKYDESIIVPELLTKESSLPEPSQSMLPSEWQGINIDVKLNTRDRSDFRERDIYAAAMNGFNYARVWLGFSTFGYPDYPSDKELVNVAELRDLDRLLALAMKYDVHLSISMTAQPGFAQYEDMSNITTHDGNWPDAERWELIRQYWVMLANRYKDIPSKYLSFSLCEEWSASNEHLDDFSKNWSRIVTDIREVSPERVLMAGFAFADHTVLPLAERMAEIGVAVAAHPYFPNQITHLSIDERKATGFEGEPEWPMVWFPTKAFNRGDSPITISGDLGGKTLSVFVFNQGNIQLGDNASITAYAGKKKLMQHHFTEGRADDPMVISIPEGTEELNLFASGDLSLYCMKLEGDFGVSQLVTTSFLFDENGNNDVASLIVDTNGTWADIDGRFYDADAFYQEGIEPYVKLAEKYNVGFMVNEFVMNNSDYENFVRHPIPMETQLTYYTDIIKLFEERDIGYVLGCISGVGGNVLIGDYGHFENFADYPNYLGEETFVNSNGFTERFCVNNILLESVKNGMKP